MESKSEVSQELESSDDTLDVFDAIIIGAGAAGIGAGIALAHSGVGSFVIIDRGAVGSSFASWPDETRFITPSFPSNSIGMLDLNSIAVGVSPAYNMRIEHPNGSENAIIGIRSHGIGPRFFAKITTGEPKPQPRRKRPTKVTVMSISYSDRSRHFSVI